MRQLRAQNRHLREQNERQASQTEKLLDAAFVTNFKLQQMERMVSGGLGLQLEMAQQQGKAGMLVPQSISLLPALDNVRQHERMTAAAKQRHMAEQRWQANKLTGGQVSQAA